MAFPKARLAVFLDGCFWHGCPYHCRVPSSNSAYWIQKIERNKARDKSVTKGLRRKGWKVVRIWEHQISSQRLFRKLDFVKKQLSESESVKEPKRAPARRAE